MSWSSRLGSWSGRFSPFGRSGVSPASKAEVTDEDYSYITSSDLKHAQAQQNKSQNTGIDTSNLPPRDTDVIILKHKRDSFPVHFPAYSIDRNELKIGEIRALAAHKMRVADPARVKLLYRGRNLREDDSTARDAGMQSNGSPEVMCVVGDVFAEPSQSGTIEEGADEDADGQDDGDESQEEGGDRSESGNAKRKRKGRHKKKKKARDQSKLDPVNGNGGETSASSQPMTPIDKVDALASNFYTSLVPLCIAFTTDPPADKVKREFEHKKLAETILAQVLLKLDAVETEGDAAARTRRKEVVRECQEMLTRLDAVMS
jgi:hypothetical protein